MSREITNNTAAKMILGTVGPILFLLIFIIFLELWR